MKIIDQVTTLIADRVNEKNRYYIIAGVLAGVLAVDYFAVMMPQIRTLIALTPKIQALSKDLKQARDDIAHKAQYEAEVARLREKMKAVDTSILSREEIPKILDNIALIASKTKIKITQVMPIKESQELVLTTNDGKYYSIPILLNARGSYHGLGHFINRIEHNKIFMTITDVDIVAASDDSVRHSTTMRIKAFILERAEGK